MGIRQRHKMHHAAHWPWNAKLTPVVSICAQRCLNSQNASISYDVRHVSGLSRVQTAQGNSLQTTEGKFAHSVRVYCKLNDSLASQATLAEIHASIPKHLYERSTFKGVCFVARDVFFSAVLYQIAIRMDPFVDYLLESNAFHVTAAKLVKLLLWASYWWWQGLVFAGLWCLGSLCVYLNSISMIC